MSTETPTGVQSTGTPRRTVSDLPADAERIGTTTDDMTVHFSRVHTSIYVADEDTIIFERDDITPGPALVGFVDHVSDTRGWASLNLYELFPDAFTAKLEADA